MWLQAKAIIPLVAMAIAAAMAPFKCPIHARMTANSVSGLIGFMTEFALPNGLCLSVVLFAASLCLYLSICCVCDNV